MKSEGTQTNKGMSGPPSGAPPLTVNKDRVGVPQRILRRDGRAKKETGGLPGLYDGAVGGRPRGAVNARRTRFRGP